MPSPVIERLYWKLIWAFAALGTVLVIGTIGYRLLAGEQYSWFDGFYMTFITVATIGYGEIIDLSQSPGGRLFTVVIGTAGLGTLWFMFSTLTVLILEGDINQALRRRRMEKTIKKLKDYYIICGYGRVGRNVGTELAATNRRYVAIDENLPMLEEQIEKDPALL
jgi:voltage-gated potassium channel